MGLLTVRFRNLRPQALATPAATVPHLQGNHLAALGIHGQPDPLFVSLLLHEAAHFIRSHLQASNRRGTMTDDRLDMEMIRQGLNALD
jgi:hypothetical protein